MVQIRMRHDEDLMKIVWALGTQPAAFRKLLEATNALKIRLVQLAGENDLDITLNQKQEEGFLTP